MSRPTVLIKRTTCGRQPLPTRATPGASGFDLAANESSTLAPGAFAKIGTGFSLAIPDGFEGQVRPRSGLAAKHGITVLNAPGTIDSDYRGEVAILLINHGREPFVIEPGMRIAQLVIARIERAELAELAEGDTLPGSDRGEGGFGSTGK